MKWWFLCHNMAMGEEAPQKKPLAERSTDEKTAVAGGIAIAIVIILFIGWVFFFFKKVQRGTIAPTFDNAAQKEFNFGSVREAQEELNKSYQAVTDEFRTIRDEASGAFGAQLQETVPQDGGADAFGIREE